MEKLQTTSLSNKATVLLRRIRSNSGEELDGPELDVAKLVPATDRQLQEEVLMNHTS